MTRQTRTAVGAGVAASLSIPTVVVAHGGAAGPPPTEPLTIAAAWHVDVPIVLGLSVAAWLYVEAVRRVDEAHPNHRWAGRRTAFFVLGRVVSALTFPVVGWVAFAGTMWVSHFSGLYNAALLDDGVHAIEHLVYLGAASLFWWPLLSPDPLRWRIHPGAKLIALLLQMPPMSFLAVTIVSAGVPLYAAYLGRPDAFGLDALADQRVAGSLMWLLGDMTFLTAGFFLLLAFVRHEDGETKRVDARLDRARLAVRKDP